MTSIVNPRVRALEDESSVPSRSEACSAAASGASAHLLPHRPGPAAAGAAPPRCPRERDVRRGQADLQAGATVQPATPVVRLIADSAPFVRFAVPPAEAEHCAPGTEIEVILAGRKEPLHARILGIASAVDPAIYMVPVEAEIEPAGAAAPDVRVGKVGKVRR